jgi:hypothetical protein
MPSQPPTSSRERLENRPHRCYSCLIAPASSVERQIEFIGVDTFSRRLRLARHLEIDRDETKLSRTQDYLKKSNEPTACAKIVNVVRGAAPIDTGMFAARCVRRPILRFMTVSIRR